MSGAALEHVGEAVTFAKTINATGFMLDFEPDTSEPAWAVAYAKYVSALTNAMHGQGLRAEMCVSSWGILDGHELPDGEVRGGLGTA